MDDNKIIDLYFERDERAIEATRAKYGARLFRVSLNVLRNNQDAEECISDTLLKAWNVIPPTRPGMLGAFLAKIVRNLSINKWKAKSAARRGGGEVDVLLSELEDCIPARNRAETAPEEAFEATMLKSLINEFLLNTEKEMRIVFVLRYFYGESISSIAERKNITESKVKSMLFRTRKKLQTHLNQKWND